MSLSLVATLNWRIAISQMALLLSGRSWYYPDIRQIDARQDIVVESLGLTAPNYTRWRVFCVYFLSQITTDDHGNVC